MLRTHPVVASLILVPLAVLAAPTERRHAKHHGDSVEHIHGLAVKAHGTLLTLAFSFLYPVGVALIRGGFQRGFLLHWATQAGATTASLGGMIIMIVKSWERLITGEAGIHHYIGIALLFAIGAQVLLGYYHHVLFVKMRHRTYISYTHIVLGWAAICGGWVNTFLGYRMGGISTPLIAIWLVWLLLASVAMVKAPNFARLFKHPQEEANYDALEQEDLVERKGSSDDNSLPMDQFTIGE